ncbi:MAG: hypothetical protein QF464_04560, partial [Myxococcota bacterium]|nr:hypothetical protein [Myxococcota bacterium]
GIVPYDRVNSGDDDAGLFTLESDDPSTLIYVEPHAFATADGEIALFAEGRNPATGEGTIVRCDVDTTLVCNDLRPVLGPSDEGAPEWLSERAGAPAVLQQESTWLLAFAFGQGAGIGLAWSMDGEDFTLDEAPLLEATGLYEQEGIDSPSLIRTETGYRLYYEGRDSDGTTRILVADGDHGLVFQRVGVALDAGLGCEDVTGQPETCWDAAGVGSPEVRPAITPAGRPVYRLFYSGLGATGLDLGFAASWDGVNFERFVYNPVVGSDAAERQPTNVRINDHYLLFFEERISNTVRGIAVSINDAPSPSESF